MGHLPPAAGGQREACVSVFCDMSVTRWSLLPLERPQR